MANVKCGTDQTSEVITYYRSLIFCFVCGWNVCLKLVYEPCVSWVLMMFNLKHVCASFVLVVWFCNCYYNLPEEKLTLNAMGVFVSVFYV